MKPPIIHEWTLKFSNKAVTIAKSLHYWLKYLQKDKLSAERKPNDLNLSSILGKQR